MYLIDAKLYQGEWNLFDQQTHNLIGDGEYELALTQKLFLPDDLPASDTFPRLLKFLKKKSLSSELVESNSQRLYALNAPKIKIKLEWPKELISIFMDKENNDPRNGLKINRRIFTRSHSIGNGRLSRSSSVSGTNGNVQQIVYRFIHQNYIQKTETWDRLICPWCSLKCSHLYILLKHLSLCHSYFKFTYTPGTSDTRIDVKVRKINLISELDPLSREGTPFDGHEPKRRVSLTRVIVCRPKRQKPRLIEFTRSFNENVFKKRTYYHSSTGLPVMPAEMNDDSDHELSQDWLVKQTTKLIDEFVDVNEGEREMMKLWNLHMLKTRFIGNDQIVRAVRSFIATKGFEILEKGLYRNCLLHLTSLADYDLLTAAELHEAVCTLQSLMVSNVNIRYGVKRKFEDQEEVWAKKVKLAAAKAKPIKKSKPRKKYEANPNRTLRANVRKAKTEMELEKQKKNGMHAEKRLEIKIDFKGLQQKTSTPNKIVTAARKYSSNSCHLTKSN